MLKNFNSVLSRTQLCLIVYCLNAGGLFLVIFGTWHIPVRLGIMCNVSAIVEKFDWSCVRIVDYPVKDLKKFIIKVYSNSTN